jgi:hypothetical protein
MTSDHPVNLNRCDTVDEIMSNTEILMQCLMDSSKTRVSDILRDHSDNIADIEEISHNLVNLNRLIKCHIRYWWKNKFQVKFSANYSHNRI